MLLTRASLQVFYFMQPETTADKLAEDLLTEIYKKFIDGNKEEGKQEEEAEGEEVKENEEDPLLEEGWYHFRNS